MSKIKPCLWFNGEAEEAARLYVSLFPDGQLGSISRYGAGAPFPEGTAMMVEFSLAGQQFQALNGGPQFQHSEAMSLSVSCEDQAEVDRYWDGLIAGGGSESRCGWLKDRFGVSWQIVPAVLGRLASQGDAAATGRMFGALMGMNKLIVAELEAAWRGEAG